MLIVNATGDSSVLYTIHYKYTMSTPVAGPSHLPHPSPMQGQTPAYDQKRRQESDDTRRAYIPFFTYFHWARTDIQEIRQTTITSASYSADTSAWLAGFRGFDQGGTEIRLDITEEESRD